LPSTTAHLVAWFGEMDLAITQSDGIVISQTIKQ